MLHFASPPPVRPRRTVPLPRLPLVGLCAALALTVGAGTLAAQTEQRPAGRRPTVPVVPVARVTADRPKPAAAKPASAKPAAKPGAKPAGARTAAKPAAPKPTAAETAATARAIAMTRLALDTAFEAAPALAADSSTIGAPQTDVAPSYRMPTDPPSVMATAAAPARFTRYRSARDSVAGATARAAAERNAKLRVVVQLDARELAVLDGADTLLVAPVAIGRDTTIRYGARTWSFDTPRGKRTVLRKDENPVWVPPDWHYVEVAARKGLKLAYLSAGKPVSLSGGRRLVVRGGEAGVLTGKTFTALPTDEEIVFGSTLYVPPLGSKNRQIPGELGRFRLALGDGYQLHGTPHEDTIGDAATHGCIRLYDEDIEWLYQHVPVGTSVYIF